MNFHADEEQRMVMDAVRALAEGKIRAQVGQWENAGGAPGPILHAIADLGLGGLQAPEELDGLGQSVTTLCLVLEELASADAGLATFILHHEALALAALVRLGTPAQQSQWARPLATGSRWAAWADNTPDLTGIYTDGHWQLSGVARDVLGARLANLVVVRAQTKQGPSLFALALPAAGVMLTQREESLGLCTVGFADLNFTAATAERLEQGNASEVLAQLADVARLGTAAIALGVARAALSQACRYAQEREQFGKPIATLQPIQWQIANSATELETSRVLVQRAAFLLSQGRTATREIAMAKAAAGQAAVLGADRAIQIHGGYGYTRDFPVERNYRDAHVLQALHGGPMQCKVAVARAA